MKTSPEIHFAQHLASNENKVRDRAIKKLRRWMSSRSTGVNAFTHDDMMKLWKGLFYCMWMSDKPLIQEDLANVISKLIHCLSRTEYSYMFIDCFLETMSREWFGLDKFRLEKFMMLVRRFLRESFQFLKKQQWNTDDIEHLIEIMKKNVLQPKTNSTYLSLKLHIIDIFMEELARTGGEELTTEQTLLFFTAFAKIMADTDSPLLLAEIAKSIFHFIIYQNIKDDLEEEVSDDESVDKKNRPECEQQLPIIKVNTEEIKQLLFDCAKQKHVKKMNRAAMYKVVKQFQDLSQGISSFEIQEVESSGSDLDESDIDKAIKQLQEYNKNYRLETEQWKNQRKKDVKSNKNKDDSKVETITAKKNENKITKNKKNKEVKKKRKTLNVKNMSLLKNCIENNLISENSKSTKTNETEQMQTEINTQNQSNQILNEHDENATQLNSSFNNRKKKRRSSKLENESNLISENNNVTKMYETEQMQTEINTQDQSNQIHNEHNENTTQLNSFNNTKKKRRSKLKNENSFLKQNTDFMSPITISENSKLSNSMENSLVETNNVIVTNKKENKEFYVAVDHSIEKSLKNDSQKNSTPKSTVQLNINHKNKQNSSSKKLNYSKKLQMELDKFQTTDIPFASFNRKAKTPSPSFLRKAIMKVKPPLTDIIKRKKEMILNKETPKFDKRVNFVLTKNKTHYVSI